MSAPQEPDDQVDDMTVMRPPRVYGQTDPSSPDAAPAPPSGPPAPPAPYGHAPYGQTPPGPASYGQAPYGQAPYGQTPYGLAPYGGPAPYGQPSAYGRQPPAPGADPYATLPPADTGATWSPGPDALDATVVPDRGLAPPADPYGFSPYADRPASRPRGPMIAVLATVGAVLVLGGAGVAVWLGTSDDGEPVAGPSSSPTATEPTSEGSEPAPEPTEDAEPTQDVADDEPWLEQQFRAGAEMDLAGGPALAPMSWDFFGDNDYTVNGDRIALTARRDFACDDLPAIPAIAEGVGDACEGGFEARVVSHDGPTVALDVVVVEMGSDEAAAAVAAAFEAAREGDPLADGTGPAHETLAAAVPQPGFEATYEILDAGEGPPILLSTASVVVLLRLGVGAGLEREQVLPVAQAVGFVVADHEAAQLFGG